MKLILIISHFFNNLTNDGKILICGNVRTTMVSYLVNNLRKWLSVIILHGRIMAGREGTLG